MWPKDKSDPGAAFVGIDFTVEIRRPGVFDHAQLETAVEGVVSDFYGQRHIASRPCHVGGLGATAGDSLIEMLNWVRDNWEILTGVAAALSAAFYKSQRLVARERARLTNGVIDPYRPGIVVTVSPRTGILSDDVTDEDEAAFPIVLSLFPELHAALTEKISTHDFSLRALRGGRFGSLHAFFKLKNTTNSDVAMMLRKIERLDERNASVPTILLYRQFGLIRRFDVSRDSEDLLRLMRR
jgi:hypothetical protein